MAALAWLLIPVVAAVAVCLWGSWAGRRRVKTPDAVGVAGYERFRAAMERTSPPGAMTARHPSGTPSAEPGAGDGEPLRRPGKRARITGRRRARTAELAAAGATAHAAATDGPARSAD
ncbi:hypothetical protein [Streptomyces albus]|uniref:hypothetical protein n=1 Tax=Streptomyces albus TaxID=1888 RepID=UPI003456E9DF